MAEAAGQRFDRLSRLSEPPKLTKFDKVRGLHFPAYLTAFAKLCSLRPSFKEIGLKYGTDKVTDHHYWFIYEKYLEPLRDKKLKMLEIGLGCDMVSSAAATLIGVY